MTSEKRKNSTSRVRRTAITIETHEITVIRRNGKQTEMRFCRICLSQVFAYEPEEFGLFFQSSPTEIQDLVRGGEIHFIEIPENGPRLICGRSLSQSKNKK